MLPSLTCWTKPVYEQASTPSPSSGKQNTVFLIPSHSLLQSIDLDSISRMTSLPVCMFCHLPILGIQMDCSGVEFQSSFLHTTTLSHLAILHGGPRITSSPSLRGPHRYFSSNSALLSIRSSALVILDIYRRRNHGNAGNGMFGDSHSPEIIYSLQHVGSLATMLHFVEVANPLVKEYVRLPVLSYFDPQNSFSSKGNLNLSPLISRHQPFTKSGDIGHGTAVRKLLHGLMTEL